MKIFKSIKTKIALSIVLMLLIISTILLAISYFTYKNTMNQQYTMVGNNIAKTSISMLDDAQVKKYVENVRTADAKEVMKSKEYKETIEMLRNIKSSNNILYLYMITPAKKGSYYIFDTDESEGRCPYGYFMKYYEGDFSNNIDEFLKGAAVDPIISNQEYGWIISVSYPYFAGDDFLGYVCVDVSMDKVVRQRQMYLLKSLAVMFSITLIFAIVYIFILNRTIVTPIKQMENAAKQFIDTKENEHETSTISLLDIKTGDELEGLSSSLKQMENDINFYIENLQKVTTEKERIGAELNIATQIQSSMLPCIFPAFPDRDELDIYATMKPAKEVGGDFYDFFMVDEKHLAIVMADVSGKGVPAALFMVIGKTLIKDHTQPGRDLGEVFTEVNNMLCESNSSGLFITAFEGVLDLETGEFRYVNAGHEMPFIYRKGEAYQAYKIRPAFVLAGLEDMKYKSGSMQLEVGDKVFQYTDGVTEATDLQKQLYGMERLEKVLNEKCKEASPEQTLEFVKADIDAFVGEADQFDDITMLCLEYKKKMGV